MGDLAHRAGRSDPVVKKQAETDAGSKKAKRNNVIGWVLCLAIAVAIGFFIRSFVFVPIQVYGDSMYPTLLPHQTLAVEKLSHHFKTPDRGDIVIVHYPELSDSFVKRIIGLPGETIEIKNSVVYIDGTPLDEPYINTEFPYSDMEAVSIPEGRVFVMGDNRYISRDSRSVGTIELSEIVGTAVMVIWPLDEAHTLPDREYPGLPAAG